MVFKDQELIAEAYAQVNEKMHHCAAAEKGCDCNKCGECRHNKHKASGCKCKKCVNEAVDQDKDGDNDFDDVKIARMVASGMSKEEAIAKVKGSHKEEKEEEKTEKKESLTLPPEKLLNFKDLYNKVMSA